MRYWIFILAGFVSATIFWAIVPSFLLLGINAIFPFGLESIPERHRIAIFVISMVLIAPVSLVSSLRTANAMHLGRTDSKPSILIFSNRSEINFRRKAIIFLVLAILTFAISFGLGAIVASSIITLPILPYIIIGLEPVMGLCIICALEINDLRRLRSRY